MKKKGLFRGEWAGASTFTHRARQTKDRKKTKWCQCGMILPTGSRKCFDCVSEAKRIKQNEAYRNGPNFRGRSMKKNLVKAYANLKKKWKGE